MGFNRILKVFCLTMLLPLLWWGTFHQNNIYRAKGSIRFISEAPLETITASSDQLIGVINLEDNGFAFSFNVSSFEGFNSPLQKEHFNEYYLETEKYPKSTFTGKMIGFTLCEEDCTLNAVAKGKLQIHGMTNIVSIPVAINFDKKKNAFYAESEFLVKLSDYDIEIPLILESKIAPEIQVKVNFDLANE